MVTIGPGSKTRMKGSAKVGFQPRGLLAVEWYGWLSLGRALMVSLPCSKTN